MLKNIISAVADYIALIDYAALYIYKIIEEDFI